MSAYKGQGWRDGRYLPADHQAEKIVKYLEYARPFALFATPPGNIYIYINKFLVDLEIPVITDVAPTTKAQNIFSRVSVQC